MTPAFRSSRLVSTAAATAIAAAAMLAAGSASANEFYVTGSIGQTSLEHEIQRDLGPNPPALPVADISGTSLTSDDGTSLQIAAGYEFDLAALPASIGIEGFYSYETAETRNINSVLVTDVDLDSRYGARLLFNYDVNDKFGIYTHGGVTVIDYDVTNSYTFAPPVTERSDSETAFAYGVGARYNLTDNVSLVLDYTRLSEAQFDGIPEVAGNTGRVNPNRLGLDRLSTGLRFSF